MPKIEPTETLVVDSGRPNKLPIITDKPVAKLAVNACLSLNSWKDCSGEGVEHTIRLLMHTPNKSPLI